MIEEMLGSLLGGGWFSDALEIQQRVLREFHRRAARALGSSCGLKDYAPEDLTIQRNLFSTLFLAAQRFAGLAGEKHFFYGLVNQCMRAWVTGCDNILDDEFKSVIPFDLPETGHRARSVLTIMTADRVCNGLLIEEMQAGRLTAKQAASLSCYTLRALVPSALQEHEEEAGAATILPPDEVIEQVHVPKTGLLFEAPIAPPEQMDEITPEAAHKAKAGLRAFGLGCQIFDDLVDFDDDVRASRHNFLLSLAAHATGHADGGAPTRDQVDLAALPLEAAGREACQWAGRHFRQARECLADLGLTLSDEQWTAIVMSVATLLRLPPHSREFIAEIL